MAVIFKKEAGRPAVSCPSRYGLLELHLGALLPDAEGQPTNFALLALDFPHEAAALTEWHGRGLADDEGWLSTTPTAQLTGLWAHYVFPRERKIAKYSL